MSAKIAPYKINTTALPARTDTGRAVVLYRLSSQFSMIQITQGKYSLREHGRGTGAAHTVDP
jgi:hypothetical protein